jgi:hypothetical protein
LATPADSGWGDPRSLTAAGTVTGRLWGSHTVTVRNLDVLAVARELVRLLREAGWTGPDAVLDEWGYNKRLTRSAEAKYRAQGLTEAQWLQVADITEWSRHAWGLAVDLDTTRNPMLATRPVDPQAHTTLPVAACPAIAAGLRLTWGGSWVSPWDPQHFEVRVDVSPTELKQTADRIRSQQMPVADFSGGRPGAAALLASGYSGVVRYLEKQGGSSVVVLSTAEYADYQARGVDVAVIYEARSAGRMLEGAPAGKSDATWALQKTRETTGSAPRVCYFAADVDVASLHSRRDATLFEASPRVLLSTQQAAVDAYLDAATAVLGMMPDGVRRKSWVYGEYSVVQHCVSTGKAGGGWQTIAWSGGQVSPYAALFQTGQQVTINGVAVDVNRVLAADGDWGQLDYDDGGFLMNLSDAEQKECLLAARNVNGAIGFGQINFPNTIKAILGTVQGVVTLVNSTKGTLGTAITEAKTAVLTGLATLPVPEAHLSPDAIGELVDGVKGVLATGLPDLIPQLQDAEIEAALRHVLLTGAAAPAPTQ